MAFQGNPNAGAPDPAILQFVAQRQKDRAAQQRQQQIDQMNAIQAAREEARAQQQFDLDMAIKNQQLMQERANTADKIQGLLRSVGTRAEAVPEEQRQAAQSSQFFGSVGDGDQQLGQEFAATVLPLDPNVFNEEMALASTLTGDRILDQDIDAVARMRGVSRSDILGGAGTQLGVRDLTAKRELAVKTAEEQRAEDRAIAGDTRARENSIAVAKEQGEIQAKARTEAIKKQQSEIVGIARQLENPNLDPQTRELLTAQHRALRADAEADPLRGVDPGAYKVRRQQALDNQRYDKLWDSNRILDTAIKRVEMGDTSSVGVQAAMNEIVQNFSSIYEDVTGQNFYDFYSESINEVLSREDITDEQREQIMEEFASQDILDRIASGRLTEADIRWTFMYAINTDGRVSNLLSEQTRKRSEFIGLGIGSKTALARMRAMKGRMDGLLTRQRDMITATTPEEAFDASDSFRRLSASKFDEIAPDPFTPPSKKPVKRATDVEAEDISRRMMGK